MCAATTSNVNSYCNSTMPENDDLTHVVTEGSLTQHSWKNDFSFRSNGCFSRLILLSFEFRFFVLLWKVR